MENLTQENWLPAVGYEAYEVSDLGRVRNAKTKKILSATSKSNRYPRVHLRIGVDKQHGVYIYVHRLVALTFLGEPVGEKNQVDHIDRNPLNNKLENLRWVTAKENRANQGAKSKSVRKDRDPIVLLDPEGNFKEEFSCINEAAEKLGLSPMYIARNIHGLQRDYTFGGFITKEKFLEQNKI